MKQILLAILMIPCTVACAQKASTLPAGWDLSYSSVLDANGVGPNEWLRKWVGPNYQSAAKGWISGWNREPIESSVLLEFPAAHAGERIIIWLVRTNNQAYYYRRVEENPLYKDDKPPNETNQSLDAQAYDNFFSVVSKWEQAKPLKPEDTPVGAIPGYSGFLSVYNSDNSRQMLLTSEDFAICDSKQCQTWKLGRFYEALKLIPHSIESQYKHKAETEIAAMTPAERVDEYANEQAHAYKTRDEQGALIRKYLWRDGLKAMPRIVEIMDAYDPATESGRSDKTAARFNAMLMLLSELDERVVRLRGTVEGRQVIDALARALVRIRAAANGKTDQGEWAEYGRFEGAKADLESAKGINLTDEAIKDTLWVKYRIKISDKELLSLTNYLIARDPTYPSWSETDYIQDDSRVNKEGYAAWVYIMKEPDRFYDAYLAFKKKKT